MPRLPSPASGRGAGGEGRPLGEGVLVAALVSALVLGMYAFGTERVGLAKDDAGQYARMAEDPAFLARLPYTFRVLTPRLASLWPGDPAAGFTAVTLASLILAGTCLHAYGRVVGLGPLAAGAGALLFAVSGGMVRLLTTPVYVDGPTYLLTVAALLLLALDRFRPFLAVVCIGVLNRETAFLLVPLYLLVARSSTWDRRRVAVAIVVPAGVFVALVIGQLWVGGALADPTRLYALRPAPSAMRQAIPSLTDLFDLFSTFGVLWLLAARNLLGPTPFMRRASAFGALVIAQLVAARGDEGRVLSHLFPIVITLAMLEVDWAGRVHGRTGRIWAGVLVLGAAASMVNARWTFLEPAPLRYALVASGTIVALLAAWRLRSLDTRMDSGSQTGDAGAPATMAHSPTGDTR